MRRVVSEREFMATTGSQERLFMYILSIYDLIVLLFQINETKNIYNVRQR